ncbi:hypothetical protein C8J56DRAFT_826245 [Mycena floridula]|nr:hypothetical protein C8J56DRAFT_826245 [Mycena floridula]
MQNDILSAFEQLSIQQGLSSSRNSYQRRKLKFIARQVQAGFAQHFGSDEHSLEAWQQLCTTVGVPSSESFSSIKECKKALQPRFVNLIDLVDAVNAGRQVAKKLVFSSRNRLAEYIRETEKVFPKKLAKKNPMMRAFLIVVGGV